MRKSLGDKRNELSEEHIAELARLTADNTRQKQVLVEIYRSFQQGDREDAAEWGAWHG